MPDYNEFLKVMKQAGNEANRAAAPANVCFGKVMGAAPLKVLVDQKMTLGAAQLVLTRKVTDYEVAVTIEWETETTEEHKHDLEGKKILTVHNSLTVGDEVVLLRQQGGQKYIVIDKVANYDTKCE